MAIFLSAGNLPLANQENTSAFNQMSAVVFNSDCTHEPSKTGNPTYTYYVKIIKKKSDYVVRMWHSIKHRFKSPEEIKLGLIESFPSEVPSTSTFQVGYLEPPSNTKRWLVEDRDLVAMYEYFESGAKINLWCDAKSSEEASSQENEPPSKKKKSQRDHQEEETEEIFTKLHDKHPDMQSPKLRLWSKLIQSGRYDNYDTPPDIPLITGAPAPIKPKKQNVTDALTGAATAIVKALRGSPPRSDDGRRNEDGTKKISPLKVTTIRRNCLDDLKRLKGACNSNACASISRV